MSHPDFPSPFRAAQPLSPEQIHAIATRRASAKLGWYTHAVVYVCVMGGLAMFGAWQGRFWPIAPALGWGLGLAIHGLRVFGAGPGSAWRARLIERERQQLQREQTLGTAP
jgi:hypothetical protein